jgi:hypothetical protein
MTSEIEWRDLPPGSEVEGLSRLIQSLLARVCASLDGLTADQLNWRPPARGSNSVYAIVAHVIGNARAWVLGIACRQPMGRDRPAEFASSGPDASALTAEAARVSRDIASCLSVVSSSDLDRRSVPPAVLWGECGPDEPYEITARDALLAVVEHASIHLGQLQLTRDLALENA